MSNSPPQFVILNGFDRSGTSMMAKVLAHHPDIECLFQPFSSTVVHKTQWKYWAPGEDWPEVQAFLDGLLNGEIDRSFIASDWFKNHSTTFDIRSGKTYVIKDTKLHFKVDWLKENYPSLSIYAIWRTPHGILASLLRNGFYGDWYGDDDYQSLLAYVCTDDALPDNLVAHVERANSDLEKMAAMVAVRTAVMSRSIPKSHTLVYENVLKDAEAEFRKLTDPLGLDPYPFSDHLDQDYNITGKQYRRRDLWKTYFDDEEKGTIDNIFALVNLPGARSETHSGGGADQPCGRT
jgi:hypothetical protein